jgi:fumigallin biosynthesis monooxygenase-like protein
MIRTSPPGAALTRASAPDGSVGIWHETYVIEAGRHEAIYNNMPVFGLSRATEHVPAKGRLETPRRPLPQVKRV